MRADMTYKDCRTKRQRRAWNYGMLEGEKQTERATAALEARNANWRAQWKEGQLTNAERRNVELAKEVEILERQLQFANDRIEQLTNSVVIIRDKK